MSSTTEQIKSRLDIAEVIQGYVKLQKTGANFKANCPFHTEKTPSFFVSPARQSWHCFGCSKGGDVFSFVMEIEGVDFSESLKILANLAGVEIQKIDQKKYNERIRLISLIEKTKEFYKRELRRNEAVISYLKKRGVSGETARDFEIGFAPNGWRNLREHLKEKGFSDLEMTKAGLTVTSPTAQSGCYDRFRNRIMFPIFDSSGQAVGFSGRIFGEGSEYLGGKYINTPQTVLYDKSSILYGFNRAKNDIRKKDFCVVVEGQMDVVMSHQAGLSNTVAVSGTALTAKQLVLIKRLTENITMSFDKDQAGVKASERGINLALESGFTVKVAAAPSGKDPADAVLENPALWISAVVNAKNIIEFYLEVFDERKDIEESVLPYLTVLPNEIEKASWVKKIAEKLKVREESVWEELKKIRPTIKNKENEKNINKINMSIKVSTKKTKLELVRERLIGLALYQKNSSDQELSALAGRIVDSEKDFIEAYRAEELNQFILAAEIFFSDKDSQVLKKELARIEKETEREKIKFHLENIADKIRDLEISEEINKDKNNEAQLEKYLSDFHQLTKHLNAK